MFNKIRLILPVTLFILFLTITVTQTLAENQLQAALPEVIMTGYERDFQAKPAVQELRFLVNGDGTITDNHTGLMWLQNSSDLSANSWQESLDLAMSFNKSSNNFKSGNYTARYNNWRLPDIKELQSLLNKNKHDQSTWLNSNGFTSIQPTWYWSNTTKPNYVFIAWVISLETSDSFGINIKSSIPKVLLVRAMQ